MSDNNSGLIMTLGAAAAGTVVGITAMFMAQNHEKQALKSQKIQRIRDRKKKYLEKKMQEEFFAEQKDPSLKKQKRRVHLYFDENDQMIEKDEDQADVIKKAVKNTDPAALDVDDLKKKLHKFKTNQSMQSYKTKITVNLGNEEYDVGKSKIQPDLFDSNDKTKNAELFIENLEKNIKRHKDHENSDQEVEELETRDRCNSLKRSMSETDVDPVKKQAKTEANESDVIMDIDPKKFTKKDHVFMDFFQMYGKNFIDQKKEQKDQQKSRSGSVQIETPGQRSNKQKGTSGANSPFEQLYQQYAKGAASQTPRRTK